MTVALEAKNTTLEEVLRYAASGDEVQLTEEGFAVATVRPAGDVRFPVPTPEQQQKMRAALARADERSKRLGLKFDLAEFKADVEEGRL
jgi:antitoxin (DNA-binding transcriptional repressor) of toxin-antitoxin stability system